MAFPAFLDTNVLYGAVLAELSRNLVKHAGLSPEKAAHRIDQMEQAFPDASVTGYDGLIDGLRCDPKDRHVLAAGIHGGCQVIVTFNTKDVYKRQVKLSLTTTPQPGRTWTPKSGRANSGSQPRC